MVLFIEKISLGKTKKIIYPSELFFVCVLTITNVQSVINLNLNLMLTNCYAYPKYN